ncbi:MAG TPA: AAA family ATPase [Saprospiraceae bacterium]|nr:AAA family ATPase [Saprospiraceae bacterium]
MKIHRVRIVNFKSIKDMDFELNDINVLIGANGAGKSNFISFFKFLKQISEGSLQSYVAQKGGAESFLYFGKKKSPKLTLGIMIDSDEVFSRYLITLLPTYDDGFIFENESIKFNLTDSEPWLTKLPVVPPAKNLYESELASWGDGRMIKGVLDTFKIYHFHDTSDTAKVKDFCEIDDNERLREDASNLAAFLYYLQNQHPYHFNRIEKTIRMVAPFFDRFNLRRSPNSPERIRLEWREVGTDKYFNAHHLSDGTIRMICLATLLLQPNFPATIIIDEPELGLHPFALNVLGGLVRSASQKTQIIISTQSVTFINNFSPKDIVVVERNNEQSEFRRLDAGQLDEWLEEYTLGEIWEKNIIGGRP